MHGLWRDSTLLPCLDANDWSAAGAIEPGKSFRDFVLRELGRCGCKADFSSLRALVHFSFHERPVGVAWRRLGPGGTALSLPAKRPWLEAYSRVLASPEQRPLALIVR